jgi:hypothetical protein
MGSSFDPDDSMRQVLDLLRADQPVEALAWLFHRLIGDGSLVQRLAARSNADEAGHRRARIRLQEILADQHEASRRGRTGPDWGKSPALAFPFALLEAIDGYLWEWRDVPSASISPQPKPIVLVEGVEYVVYRRPLARTRQARSAAHAGEIKRRLRHHWIFPKSIEGYRVEVLDSKDEVRCACRSILECGEARVYVGTFPGKNRPDWIKLDPEGILAHRVRDVEERTAAALEHLERAKEQRADFVVFPELTACAEVREAVAD